MSHVEDYNRVIEESSMTHEQINALVANTADRQDLDLDEYGVTLEKSEIEGIGMFAAKHMNAGEDVMPSRVAGKRTQAGRYVNHSMTPNAVMVNSGNDVMTLRTSAPVEAGEELTVSYRQVDLVNRADLRKKILDAEDRIQNSPDKVEEPPHIDHFSKGLYARELFVPAGIVMSTKIHLVDHFLFVMKGRAVVVDEFNGVKDIVGPCMMETKAGTKRILKVTEDLLLITVHATEETDVDIIESQVVGTEFPELLEGERA